jgi:hypothetical protein
LRPAKGDRIQKDLKGNKSEQFAEPKTAHPEIKK